MKLKTNLASAAVALMLLGLAACGGDSDSDETGTSAESSGTDGSDAGDGVDLPDTIYDFDDQLTADPAGRRSVPGQPLGIALSDDLAELAPPLTVSSYVVSTTAFPTGMCRLDIQINWASEESLAAPEVREQQLDRTGSWREIEIVAELPDDAALTDSGTWVLEDYSAVSRVSTCGRTAGDRAMTLRLPILEPLLDDYFAKVEVTALADGSTYAEGSVRERYTSVSVAGSWVREDPPVPVDTIDGTYFGNATSPNHWSSEYDFRRLDIENGRVFEIVYDCTEVRTSGIYAIYDGDQLITRGGNLVSVEEQEIDGGRGIVLERIDDSRDFGAWTYWAEGTDNAKEAVDGYWCDIPEEG